MEAEGQSDRIVSGMEVSMKQTCAIEFLHVEKIILIDIHWCLLNISEIQTVDVSTVRWWVVCFSSNNSDCFNSTGADFYKHSMQLLFIAGDITSLMVEK